MKILCSSFIAVLALAGCSSASSGSDPVSADDDDDDGATGLGCRDIAISSGADGNDVKNSGYFTSFIAGTDFSEFLGAGGWAEETISLCAGEIGPTGTAPLTLKADAMEAISLPADNCLCRQLSTVGSSGTLYCSASPDFLDFTMTRDSLGSDSGRPEWVSRST